MGYRVHRSGDKFKVVEVSEGEVRDIMVGLSEDKAKLASRRLNFGGGFDSWTPDFFLQKIELSV
jgi:hypothetical protein